MELQRQGNAFIFILENEAIRIIEKIDNFELVPGTIRTYICDAEASACRGFDISLVQLQFYSNLFQSNSNEMSFL